MKRSVDVSSQLYDKVHAAMVNWLVRAIRKRDSSYRVYPEFVYNYYGYRGSVDIVTYHSAWLWEGGKEAQGVIELYEVWSAIHRLEEALRKFNEKTEFVPKYFQMTRKPKERMVAQFNFFVLLNSLENIQMVKDHWHIFWAQSFESHRVSNFLDWGISN